MVLINFLIYDVNAVILDSNLTVVEGRKQSYSF